MRAKAGSWLVNSSVVMLCRSPGLWRGLCLSTVWIELFQWGDPYWAPADLAPEAHRGERVQVPELREEVPREAGLAETVRMPSLWTVTRTVHFAWPWYEYVCLCMSSLWACTHACLRACMCVSTYSCMFGKEESNLLWQEFIFSEFYCFNYSDLRFTGKYHLW